MNQPKKTILHGTAVLIKSAAHPPAAVFLRGLSGSGKSDLAFRLIEKAGGLISDDQVAFERRQDHVYAESIETIRGLLEVRGIGLLKYPSEDRPHRVKLVIDLVKNMADVTRLPEWETVDILGVSIPRFSLYAFETSALRKVLKAMEIVHQKDMLVK